MHFGRMFSGAQVPKADPLQLSPKLQSSGLPLPLKQQYSLAAEAGMPADMISAYVPQRECQASSPGSDGSTSTAMHQQPAPAPGMHAAAFDWTPKKGDVAASLAHSSASPVSVIPRTNRRRAAAPDVPATEKHRAAAAGARGRTGAHASSRLLGTFRGGNPYQHPAGLSNLTHINLHLP